MHQEPLTIISPSAAGERLAEVIDAHLALEEARLQRSRRVHLMGLLSLPLALVAVWPSLWSEIARRAVLTFWAFSALAVVLALLAEWRVLRAVR